MGKDHFVEFEVDETIVLKFSSTNRTSEGRMDSYGSGQGP